MKLLTLLCAPLMTGVVCAQVDAVSAFRGDLFAPDLILRESETLRLTNEQRDALAKLVKETKQAFARGQPRLRDATAALAQSLKVSPVTEQVALDQFKAILDAEQELKVAQLLMLVRATNLLTSTQREQLHKMVKSLPAKSGEKQVAGSGMDARQELNARMQKVQAEVDRWRSEGRDPAPILELIKLFGEQMQAGRISEAKETLQRAAERLDEPKPR